MARKQIPSQVVLGTVTTCREEQTESGTGVALVVTTKNLIVTLRVSQQMMKAVLFDDATAKVLSDLNGRKVLLDGNNFAILPAGAEVVWKPQAFSADGTQLAFRYFEGQTKI